MNVLNQVGKPVWLVLMVVGFIWFWPVGLAIFAYLVWNGRLGATAAWSPPWAKGFWGSGNQVFNEHRAEMLAKLEAEQTEFAEFVEQLRKAKDRSEFDAFVNRQARK